MDARTTRLAPRLASRSFREQFLGMMQIVKLLFDLLAERLPGNIQWGEYLRGLTTPLNLISHTDALGNEITVR